MFCVSKDITDIVYYVLDRVKDNRYYSVIYTALSTGLRQAELLSLRWRDLDLDMMSISGLAD